MKGFRFPFGAQERPQTSEVLRDLTTVAELNAVLRDDDTLADAFREYSELIAQMEHFRDFTADDRQEAPLPAEVRVIQEFAKKGYRVSHQFLRSLELSSEIEEAA